MKRYARVQARWLIILALGLAAFSPGPRDGVGAQATRQRRVGSNLPEPQAGGEQTIRVGTQLVNVLFSATDKENRYLNDLTKSEVTVLENGKPQEIFTFKREQDLPLTIAILVDVSNSVIPILPRLTVASSRFINSVMRPGQDQTALIQFDNEAVLIRDLTSDPLRLRNGLREIAENAPPPPRRIYGGLPPPVIFGSRVGGTSIFDSISVACSDLLAGKTGRKTVILFTDGFDTTSKLRRFEAVEDALRAETVIYAIGVGDAAGEGVNKGELNRICEPTGGRAFIPRDAEELDEAFAELEREMRQQYLLAYEPTDDTADGSFRKIEVRIPKRRGVRVRHRLGYYALPR
ncbi:MAG TPA: VWA domain-containing protein [Blastocatellia bacterium]|nr:VWA domain-containing protein [Blastocatellia bacterium]